MNKASYANFSQYPDTAERSVLSMLLLSGTCLGTLLVSFGVEIGAFEVVLAVLT